MPGDGRLYITCMYIHVHVHVHATHVGLVYARDVLHSVHVIKVLCHCSGGFRDWFIRQQRGFVHGHGCTSSSRLQKFGNLAEIPRLHG